MRNRPLRQRPVRVLTRAELARVDQLIDSMLPNRPTLQQLADHLYLSRCHFSRVLKATTGHSPMQYVLVRRVLLAQKLLRSRRHEAASLAVVAGMAGFYDQSHMTTAFVRVLGRSPGVVRRR